MTNSLENLRPVFVFGKLCMYTEDRIKATDVYEFNDERKQNLQVYSIRHEDDSEIPAQLCTGQCMVNRLGSLLTIESLDNGIIDFDNCWIDMKEADLLDDRESVEAILDDLYCESFEYDMIGDTYPTSLKAYLDLVSVSDPTGWDIPISRIHKELKAEHYVFISQPYTGYDDKEIIKQRHLLFELYCYMRGWNPWNRSQVQLINQHTPKDPYENMDNFADEGQLHFYQFCRSIGYMAKATDVIVYGNYSNSRGCCLELKILDDFGCYDTREVPQLQTNGVTVCFEDELIEFCKRYPMYDDVYFSQLWKEEYFKAHEVIVPKGLGEAYDEDEDPEDAEKDE